MAGLRGLTRGVTNLTLTSAGLATAVYSVYVTAEFGSINSKYSTLLGVQIGGAPQGPTGDGHAFSAPLGLAVGPIVSALVPRSGEIGATVEIELQGAGLENATELRLDPADGVVVDSLLVDPLGEFVRAELSIAADAPETARRVRLFGAGAEIPFADPAASVFLVTAPAPMLQAVSPNTLEIGAGIETFTLYGVNLDRASRVDALPPQGLVIGAPAVSADGTRLTVVIEALADAAPGERVLTVTTPAGTTATRPDAVNTLTLYEGALAMPTPVVASVVGVELGDGPSAIDLTIDALAAPLLGVAVEQTTGPPSVPAVVAASVLGVTSGPFTTRVEAPPLILGDTYKLRVYGQDLGAVDGAGVFPGLHLAVGTPVPAADGSSVAMSLTIPPDAAVEPRELRLVAGPDRVLFTDPAAAVLERAVGVPEIDSIQPIVAQLGDRVELIVRGANLHRGQARACRAAGRAAIRHPIPRQPGGDRAAVRLYVAQDAALGARIIRVETPAGTSTASASPANTFTVY